MELLDRYLHAIKFWLPRDQQDDIVAELADDIRSQIADEEERLGRKLNDAELAAILKQRGRPVLVANRYLPQRSLIGPMWFPTYLFILKIVVPCYVVPWLLVWIGLKIFHPFYHSDLGALAGGLWGTFWSATFMAVGVVTLIFAILERVQAQTDFLGDWDPRKLPAVRDPNRIPRLNSILELAANVVFIVWWINGLWSQTLFDRAGVRIVLAPVWKTFFWIFLLTASANIILSAASLFYPYWTRLRAGIRLAIDSIGMIAFCWLARSHILAEINVPNLSAARAAEITNAINVNMAKSLPLVVIACAIIASLDVFRLVRASTGRARLVPGLALIVVLIALAAGAGAQATAATPATGFALASSPEIRELLVDHVDVQHRNAGTVLGIRTG